MKKKSMIWSMLTIMMVAVLSTTFIACEDKEKEENAGTSVIGVWSGRTDNNQLTLTFKNGNTGTFISKIESADNGTEVDTGTFTYTMETKEKGLLVIKFNDSHHSGENQIYYFVLESKTMSVYANDYFGDLEWLLTKQS